MTAPVTRWTTATISGLKRPLPRSVQLRLDVTDRVDHLPGQHYVLRLTAPDGYVAQRSYSVASAPVLDQLESLSLSMGTLTDTGAEALLGGQPLTHLRQLDLGHHFLSEAVADRVRAAFASAGTDVDLSDAQTPHRRRDEEWRFVAVSE